jgi:uncharacterized protein (DUF2141 family)
MAFCKTCRRRVRAETGECAAVVARDKNGNGKLYAEFPGFGGASHACSKDARD